MLRKIVRFALRQRLLVLGGAALIVVLGVRSFNDLDVEAFPDVEDVRVQVIAQWPGHAAEEIERSVTLPIERLLNGTPSITNIRSTSMLGLSVVTLTFDEGTPDYFARQQVLERMQGVNMPAGVSPQLGSLSNSTGEIYRYTVAGKLPLTELKAVEDWTIEPAIRTVMGIADVVSFGGQVKQYQIDVDPTRLRGYEKQVVRGVGLFRSVNDIGDVALGVRGGVPIRVADVGSVRVGGATREGI